MLPERVNELWELFLTRKLDDAGASELLAHLQSHPDELQRRRAEAAIHGGLKYLYGSDAESERLRVSVQARLNTIATPDADQDFERRVMLELRDRQKPRARSLWWKTGAVAAVLLLVAGVYAFRAQNRTEVASGNHTKKVMLELQSGRATTSASALQGPTDAPLSVGETLKLDAGANAHISLPDGTSLTLSDGATLMLLQVDAPIVIQFEHGIVDVDVRPQPAGKEMLLETKQARIRVIGTKYRVVASEIASRVDVERGKVAVSSLKATGAEQTLEIGQTVSVDQDGMGAVLAAREHVLLPGAAQPEGFTDPVQLTACDTPAPWPARRFTYTRPAGKSFGYGGAVWKATFEAGEDGVDIWIRPRRVELARADYRLMKLALLVNTGPTEYRIGELEIYPNDRGWMLLRGRFAGATVNWQQQGSAASPLQALNVRQISLRSEIGNIEFDFGPMQIAKTRP